MRLVALLLAGLGLALVAWWPGLLRSIDPVAVLVVVGGLMLWAGERE